MRDEMNTHSDLVRTGAFSCMSMNVFLTLCMYVYLYVYLYNKNIQCEFNVHAPSHLMYLLRTIAHMHMCTCHENDFSMGWAIGFMNGMGECSSHDPTIKSDITTKDCMH